MTPPESQTEKAIEMSTSGGPPEQAQEAPDLSALGSEPAYQYRRDSCRDRTRSTAGRDARVWASRPRHSLACEPLAPAGPRRL